jgi:hypothetical protein
MPGFEEALGQGAVSAGHVDAVATATRHLTDDERAEFVAEADGLLTDATRQGVDGFARNCRDLARGIRGRRNSRADVDELAEQRRQSKVSRWVDRQTGMHKTLIECDPVTDRFEHRHRSSGTPTEVIGGTRRRARLDSSQR